MPAGVTWGRYLRFLTASMLTMFAGAQTIHVIYKPLDDMADWVEKEKAKLKQKEATASSKNS